MITPAAGWDWSRPAGKGSCELVLTAGVTTAASHTANTGILHNLCCDAGINNRKTFRKGESMAKTGQNAPCPCGSGKKYKKCCYGKNVFNNHGNSKVLHSILPPRDMIDYGDPSINESFFQKNTVHEISSPRFLYSHLLMPELEIEVSKLANQLIIRGRDEAILIVATLLRQLADDYGNNFRVPVLPGSKTIPVIKSAKAGS